MQTLTCAECGRAIADSEPAHLRGDEVICEECHTGASLDLTDASSPPPLPRGGAIAPAPVLGYHTPRSAVGAVGIWREGKLLVIRRERKEFLPLPSLCIKCNAPAEEWRKNLKLSWSPPGAALAGGALIALLMSKRARVSYSLCQTHLKKRRMGSLVGGGLAALGVLCIVGGFAFAAQQHNTDESIGYAIVIAGFALLLAGGITAAVMTRTLTPAKIDADFAWLKGAGPAFLNNFPDN